jgi:hypothetical protein
LIVLQISVLVEIVCGSNERRKYHRPMQIDYLHHDWHGKQSEAESNDRLNACCGKNN